ncbi:sensor histidine kinase [Sporosarcina limicola]|uniref:histidine kinase n=1 Tax=Sporosarcina limicola TaxID=34101 RepID=A0A927MJ61_9BACL|nr:HAMP domain-containing sensor histidine kinase [Sporosarcina limicola]MBE1555578.1 signal transduction histidine kinase [Sporosarcina limicola]
MTLNDWMKKWFAAVSVCLLLFLGCVVYLFADHILNDNEAKPAYVINPARLLVSDSMVYLEQYHDEIDPIALQAICDKNDMSLLVTQLDGNVLFNSSADKTIQKVDVKTSLHYDLYTAKVEKDFFKITFPIVDDQTHIQMGNAIFLLPKRAVGMENTYALPLIPLLLMSTFLLFLVGLLFILKKKMKKDIIQPIQKLSYYSEAILKGDYEQKAEYGRTDEMGEVYAVFDQMRIEIMHHSKRRDAQEKAQKELITTISHEIKTPLTTVKAYIDAISDGVCPDMESVMEYIEVMRTNTNKMTRLVEDLLLHALQELGQISVNPIEQYSKSMLLQMIKPMGHYVRTAGVSFIEPREIPDVLIDVDANRLEQVISNLITNALKHTSPGDSIRIQIEQELEQLKITIADTGEGILPQDMPFIFGRYFKGQVNAKNEGNGLGLSICKHIIEAHHGSISFKSTKGEGTVFYFTIPLC